MMNRLVLIGLALAGFGPASCTCTGAAETYNASSSSSSGAVPSECSPGASSGGSSPMPGEWVWSRGFGAALDQSAYAVDYDSNQNLIVTGTFAGEIDFGDGPRQSSGEKDIFVLKFDPFGELLWSRTFGNERDQMVRDVAVDEDDDIWLVGAFSGSLSFGGPSLNSSGTRDGFVVELDPSGNHLSSRKFGATLAGSTAEADVELVVRSIAVDGGNNIVFGGNFGGKKGATFDVGGDAFTTADAADDIFVAKYDATGQHQWSRRFGSTSGQYLSQIAVDDDRIVLTGEYLETIDFGLNDLPYAGEVHRNIFVAKLNPDGTCLWSRGFGGPADQGDASVYPADEYARSVAVVPDGSGDVIVFGAFNDEINFDPANSSTRLTTINGGRNFDLFLARLAGTDGAHEWSWVHGGAAHQEAVAVAVTPTWIWLTGNFTGQLDLGCQEEPLTNVSVDDTEDDLFIARFGHDGNCASAAPHGSKGRQAAWDLATNPNEHTAVVGRFLCEVDFGQGRLGSKGDFDIFVAEKGP
jgi:hypothetical protein